MMMIINNYSPKWKVEVMNVYLNASRLGNGITHSIINTNYHLSPLFISIIHKLDSLVLFVGIINY